MPATAPPPPRPSVRPVVLLILDGFGAREGNAPDDAIAHADMPNWRRLLREVPNTTIDASEHHVGLPDGQMGNSEVGHLNIGAGRVVYQDFTRIDHEIETSGFTRNPVLNDALAQALATGGVVHVLGLVSPGGVHSHERHIAAFIELAAAKGIRDLAVHAFLDGRDTPPRSAAASLAFMETVCAKVGARGTHARIASICGRYYAMDRDKRWERVAGAYALIVDGEAPYTAGSAAEALESAYARGESDEFVKPTAIVDDRGRPQRLNDGDVVVFMNFRADRARQLTRALTDPAFDGFPRARVPKLARYVTLTSYGDEFAHLSIAYPPQTVRNSFGEYIASLGLTQLRIAETEKYAHVTYFFNGGTESVYPGEDRIMVPSPRIATYDLKPEMSAFEVTDRLVAAIASGRYDAIVCNYANARHGRPYRQLRGDRQGGRDARRLHRARRRGCAGRRRRGAHHIRSRQRRNDPRPGNRAGAYRPYAERRAAGLRRARRPNRRGGCPQGRGPDPPDDDGPAATRRNERALATSVSLVSTHFDFYAILQRASSYASRLGTPTLRGDPTKAPRS